MDVVIDFVGSRVDVDGVVGVLVFEDDFVVME